MSIDLAAAYLGISESKFRLLGIVPRNIDRRVVWDRACLDRFADHLAGEPMTDAEQKATAADVERAFLERRRNRG